MEDQKVDTLVNSDETTNEEQITEKQIVVNDQAADKSSTDDQRPKDGSSQKKRKSEFKDSSRTRKKLSKDDPEIRFLISNKEASLLIGKKGSNITFLRKHYNCSVVITDGAGPERVLSLGIGISQIEQILRSIIGYLEENNQNSDVELRLLLHTNFMGSLIGKNGKKLKDIRQSNKTSIKIFAQCCPSSSERVCIVQGQSSNVISCIKNILEIVLSQQQPVGKNFHYNPANYIPDYALSYGGFLPESSIKNRGFTASNTSRQQKAPNNRKRFNSVNKFENNFSQPLEVWNRNAQPFIANWPQTTSQLNQVFNPGLQDQTQLASTLNSAFSNYQNATDLQHANSFQGVTSYQQQPLPPQQNLSFYLDSSAFTSPSSTVNNQLPNSNDLVNHFNHLNSNPLTTTQLNTFWTSYYNGESQNNLNLPIN